MAKTPKKASTKAIAFCSKLAGKELPKSSSWEALSDIIMSNEFGPGFVWDLKTQCKSQGDSTIANLYKEPGEKEDLVETFSWPNSEAYDEKECDWYWPFLYKQIVEYLMKNWKALTKGKKPKKKAPKVETGKIVNVRDLMREVEILRGAIKDATGKEKKKLIAEYNEKSKLLNEQMEQNGKVMDEKKAAAQADIATYESLRKRKQQLYHKVRNLTLKGENASEYATELARVTKELNNLPKPKKS